MKKRRFNIADIFIILILIISVAGIAVRAFRLTDAKTENYYNYRVKFTASLDEKQKDAVTAGATFLDDNKTEYKLLEGYWITQDKDTASLDGEFIVFGRVTESGFESNGSSYFKNDTVSLKGNGADFKATLIDFIKQ